MPRLFSRNNKKISLHRRIFSHPLGQGSFKDFFIPHHGNKHQPKSLHPKRVLFHISVALVTKAIVLMFVLNYPITAWMTPDVSAGESKKIITLTNSLRASVGVTTLSESQKLNQAAYSKVQDMFINQYFAHRSPAGLDLEYFARRAGYTNYSVIGENLAVGFDNAPDVMTAWQNSPSHYRNLVDANYREIGVSLAGGQYKDKDTVFIAQYFGVERGGQTVPEIPKKTIEKVVTDQTPTVLSEKTTPKSAVSAPKATPPKTTVVVSKPSGNATEKVVRVTTTLPSETTAAFADVFNHKIALEPKANGQWQGQEVITTNKEPASVVPPSLTVSDASGASTRTDIPAGDVVPEKSSLLEQYSLYRQNPNTWLGRIFDISSWYYKIILGLAIISLILNIFIARHKQHPHLILSGLGLIIFMAFLIVF